MSSVIREKLGYVRDRFVNALWMIRNGKFKLIVKSIFIELDHRVMKLKVLLLHGKNPDYSKLPGSAYINRRKVIPPSYKPTHFKQLPAPTLQVDKKKIARKLETLRKALVVKDPDQP